MSIHNEIEFENEICEHLSANDWLYADKIDVREYATMEAYY